MAGLADRFEVVSSVGAALSLIHNVIDFGGWSDAIHALACLAEVTITPENRVSKSSPRPSASPLPATLALPPVDGAVSVRLAVPMRGCGLAPTHGRLAWAWWLGWHL